MRNKPEGKKSHASVPFKGLPVGDRFTVHIILRVPVLLILGQSPHVEVGLKSLRPQNVVSIV